MYIGIVGFPQMSELFDICMNNWFDVVRVVPVSSATNPTIFNPWMRHFDVSGSISPLNY